MIFINEIKLKSIFIRIENVNIIINMEIFVFSITKDSFEIQ